MEVLTVPVPFESLVHGLVRAALGERLADAQPPSGRVPFTLLLSQTTDPALPGVVGAMSPEDVVDLIDQTQGQLPVSAVPGAALQLQQVADGEGVRPQVAPRRPPAPETRTLDEGHHDLAHEVGRVRIGHWHCEDPRRLGLTGVPWGH
jgi:hypothetical protein